MTIRNWAGKGIIGQQIPGQKMGRWQFSQEDVLIAAAILRKGKRVSPEDKMAISQAVKTGQPLEEVLPKPRRRERGKGTIKRLTQLQEILKEVEFPKPFLGLREAAQFLQELSPDHYPSRTSLLQLIKIAVIHGNFPLPPEAVRVTVAGQWRFKLTKESLLTVFEVTLKILETRDLPLEKTFLQAKKTFQEEGEKRIHFENLSNLIFQNLGSPRGRKDQVKDLLFEKIQKELGIKPQEILILGIPKDDQEDLVAFWTESIKEEVRPSNYYILENWPSLTDFLKEQLGLLKINPWRVAGAAAWLEEEGISITTIRCQIKKYPATYYRLSLQEQEQLKTLLTAPEKEEELKEILSKTKTEIHKTKIPKAPRRSL